MSDNTGRPGLPAPPATPTETLNVPPPAGGRRRIGNLGGNFQHQGTKPPDRGRSVEEGLAELQRRRTQGEPGRRTRKPRTETYTAPDGTRIEVPPTTITADGPRMPPVPPPGVVAQPQAPAETPLNPTAAAVTSLLQQSGTSPASIGIQLPGPAPAPTQPAAGAAPTPPPAQQWPALYSGDGMQPVQLLIDGHLHQLPLGEIVAGYIRMRDYSQKTQQAAMQLRQAQEAQGQFNAARERLEQRLVQLITLAPDEFAAPVDWVTLSRTDPIGYSQKHARYLARQELLAEQQRLADLRAREEGGRKQFAIQTGHQTLAAIVPGWSDPALRGQLQARMLEHLKMRGFTPDEIHRREMIDPREVIMLLESMLWAQHAAQGLPQPKAVGAATLPGNGQRASVGMREGPSPDVQGLDEQFTRTRKLDDAVALLQARRALENGGFAGPLIRPNGRG